MPELPEVETVKNVIGPQTQGLTIKNVTVNRPEVVAHPTAALFCEATKCLFYFIEKNKILPEDYLKTKGQDYRNTPFLQVYGHAGEPCPNCGETLIRTVIGGRGSVYCPNCKREH